jgi:CheY-like chemotaxis protein
MKMTRILLLETVKIAQLRFAVAFEETEIQIVPVATLEEAMRSAFGGEPPDALLLNLGLPGVDAREVARSFKLLWTKLPLVVYAAEEPEAVERVARDLGSDGGVSLLMPDRELVQAVTKILYNAALAKPGGPPAATADRPKPDAAPERPRSGPQTPPSPLLAPPKSALLRPPEPPRPQPPKPDAAPRAARPDGPPSSPALPAAGAPPERPRDEKPGGPWPEWPDPTRGPVPLRAAPALKLAPAPALKKSAVLLVDDEPMQLMFQRVLLAGDELKLVEAKGGQEALSQAKLFRPDVIVLDFMMPGIDGLETAARLRADPALAKTPILMTVTQVEVSYAKMRAAELALELIVKPLEQSEFVARVQGLLARS